MSEIVKVELELRLNSGVYKRSDNNPQESVEYHRAVALADHKGDKRAVDDSGVPQ